MSFIDSLLTATASVLSDFCALQVPKAVDYVEKQKREGAREEVHLFDTQKRKVQKMNSMCGQVVTTSYLQ